MLFAALMTSLTALPTVAIDAGHGGAQRGAAGVCGILEKDVTLALAERLRDILAASNMVDPLLLRHGDETVSLDERAARANAAGAAVLVSIHANASSTPTAHGVETFFLSQNAASGRLAHLARRENDGVLPEVHLDSLQRVLHGLTLDFAQRQSQSLALKMQGILSSRLHSRGRGVLQAPFLVLLGAHMAAVLVEVGFLTHPQECQLLANPSYQQDIAEALATATLAHLALEAEALATRP